MEDPPVFRNAGPFWQRVSSKNICGGEELGEKVEIICFEETSHLEMPGCFDLAFSKCNFSSHCLEMTFLIFKLTCI